MGTQIDLEKLQEFLRSGQGAAVRMSVGDARAKVLSRKGLSAKTMAHYGWMFDKMAKCRQEWPSDSAGVQDFMNSLEGLGDESVAQMFRLVRSASRFLATVYKVGDGTVGMARPRVEHKRRRYLSAAELRTVIGGCRDETERALVLALIDSSARIGDIAPLTTDMLHDGWFESNQGKTGQRHYRCDNRVIELLRRVAVDGVCFPAKVKGSRVLFAKPIRPVDAVNLGIRVAQIMRRAGLTGEKLGPHTLRHSAASLVARETKSALAVKAVLQHDNVATSMGYIHDAEDSIAQGVSPLALAGGLVSERVSESAEQLGLGDGANRMALVPVETVTIDGVVDLVEDLLPVIPEGVSIRPQLVTEDLTVIRDAFVLLMRDRNENGSGSRCVQLMRRMLRRVA